MRLDQLKVFCSIVEMGSLRKAADNLYLSPQAVSKSMIQLEQELGVSLYTRGSKGIAVTEKGKLAYEAAKKVLSILLELQETFIETAASKSEVFSVCVAFSLNTIWGHLILEAMAADPDASVDVVYKTCEEIRQFLSSKNDDLVYDIVMSNVVPDDFAKIESSLGGGFHCYRIYDDLLCVQVPCNDSLAEKDSISWEEASQLSMIIANNTESDEDGIEEEFGKRGLPLGHISRMDDLSVACAAALKAGRYSIVLYPTVAECRPLEGVCYIPLEPPMKKCECIFIRKGLCKRPFAARLFNILGARWSLEKIF